MVCVGSCFVDPHGLSCDFGASEKFACCVFFSLDHQDRSCKMTTVGMMLLNLVFMVGWEPFLLKSSLRSSPCAPFFDVCGISKGLHKKSLLRIRPRVVEKWWIFHDETVVSLFNILTNHPLWIVWRGPCSNYKDDAHVFLGRRGYWQHCYFSVVFTCCWQRFNRNPLGQSVSST